MLSFSQCEYFPHITEQLSIWQCLHLLFLFTMWIFSSITLQLSIYNVEIKFHCFHTVLFTITVPSILTVLFTFAFLFTIWIFFHSYCIIVYSTMLQWGFIGYIQFCLQLLSPSTVCAVYISFLFTMWYFFTITAQLTLQQCLQHIRNIYIQYCLQLLSPVYLLWCLHVLSFSQCEYFPAHYCTIV